MVNKKARKIRIRIKNKGKRIWLPAVPFWFLRFSWSIAKRFIKVSGPDPEAIRGLDAKMILDELSRCGSFVMVDVYDKNEDTKVYIEII
jgi:hypothetical protein